MQRKKIILRADGNSAIGLGHIYRLLAIADMLRQTFDCIFITQQVSSAVRIQMLNVGIDVIETGIVDVNETTKELPFDIEAFIEKDSIVITDGYYFGTIYQQAVKATGAKLVCIDDMAHLQHYYADAIINHGDAAIASKYCTEPYTKVYAGFPYLIMRSSFLAAAQQPRMVQKADTVFICMGGADPFNVTIKVLAACATIKQIRHINIVTGAAYQFAIQLQQAIANTTHQTIRHETNISAERMVQLIRESEIAVCPASSIALEVCAVKAGLLTGTVVDNQSAIHQQLTDHHCCISLNDFNTATIEDIASRLESIRNVEKINSVMQQQARAIDGLSGERILDIVKTLAA